MTALAAVALLAMVVWFASERRPRRDFDSSVEQAMQVARQRHPSARERHRFACDNCGLELAFPTLEEAADAGLTHVLLAHRPAPRGLDY